MVLLYGIPMGILTWKYTALTSTGVSIWYAPLEIILNIIQICA